MSSPSLRPHHRPSCRPAATRDPLALPLLKEEEEEEDLECGGSQGAVRSDADSVPLVSTVSSVALEGTPESSTGRSWHQQERSYSTTSPFMPTRAPPSRSATALTGNPVPQAPSPELSSNPGTNTARPQLRHQQTFPLPCAAHIPSEVSSLKTTPIPVCPVVVEGAETGPTQRSIERRNLKLFVQGDRRSLISARGNLNVHRLIPYITKVYLNWLYDTFPSIIRLKWHTIFFLVIIIYIIVILLYAICFWSFDSNFVCTNHVHDFGDYYFFVVQTLFTIGYGGKEPLCFVTNVGVTIISILGLLQHTALTGIVFAKFTLDSSRDLACAFSTRLFAIPPCEDSFTALGGIDSTHSQSAAHSVAGDSEHVRLCFRFVNVFHRHFFHVSMRLFLIEHHPASEDNWSCPTVQELHYFDTSIPLEFMSLPVEVCAYIPIERLPLLNQADVLDDDEEEEAGTPGGRSVVSGAIAEGPTSTSTVGQHFWVRHFSEHYKVARQMSGAPPMALPHTMPVAPNIWPSTTTPRSAHGDDPITPQRGVATPRRSYAASSVRSSCLKTVPSSFELVCTLEFTDATTGHEISAKKSWPLTDVTWLPPGTDISMCWMSIVQRVGNTGVYNVDVSNLDSIATYDYEDSEACSSFGGTSSYGVQSPEREVDFSKSNPEFSVDTSLVNHVSRPTVSRVWSSAATAEAAKDEELPDPTWNIRLGVYRGDFEASPERDDEGDNKPGRRDNDRLSRLHGGVSNRWLSAEDPKSLLSSKTVGNEFSRSNVTADVTSRSAAAILSNAAAGSASRNQRYMRSRTMSNIGEIGSRFSVGNRKQSQRRAFGAGLVDSLD